MNKSHPYTLKTWILCFFLSLFSGLALANPILLNSGFEIPSALNPGGAANWYGYTFSSDGGVGLAEISSQPGEVSTGSAAFALEAVSSAGGYSAAWVESDRYLLPSGPLNLSFQFKNILATASGIWSEYKIRFYDAANAEITAATLTRATGYSWGHWSTIVEQNIAAPSQATRVSISFLAYASTTAGSSRWAFDNVVLAPQPIPALKTVLLDIGRSNADGGWYEGATPASPDTHGNYWNTLDSGTYAGNMKDKTNGSTTIGAGFIDINQPEFTWYNGPAGDNTNPWSIDSTALGDLGNREAAFDYVYGSDVRLSIDGLTSGKTYRLKFFCSRRFAGDPGTTISVFSDNTFDPDVILDGGTVANRNEVQPWLHNADTLLTLDNITASGPSLFISIIGSNFGDGVLNSMSIEELDVPGLTDTTPPIINISGSNPETVLWGSVYSDSGATATDNGTSVNVSTNTSAVNTSVLGSYLVTYSATDAANNIASSNRIVNVILPGNADVPASDGLSPLLRYVLGASSPTSSVSKPSFSTDTSDLILTALIRTSGISAVGQISSNLTETNGGFTDLTSNPHGVLATNQANLVPGTERREFRTPKDGAKKFLRLKVTYTNSPTGI